MRWIPRRISVSSVSDIVSNPLGVLGKVKMVNLLIDLDGTLTDTTSDKFTGLRDNRNYQFNSQDIPLMEGALDFVQHVKTLGHSVAIISDSQPNYVERMAREIFDVPCVSLAYKPKTKVISPFLLENFGFPNTAKAEDFLFIGDTKLDIYMARNLKIPSVCLDFSYGDISNRSKFYQARSLKINLGATYYCKNYQDILEVLENPAAHRYVLEDKAGRQVAKFLSEPNRNSGYTMFRALARQQKGGFCDKFGAVKRYNDFQSETRSANFVSEIAEDVSRYLSNTACAHPDKFSWDYITCVPDKKTTTPPKKWKSFYQRLMSQSQKNNFSYGHLMPKVR